MNNYDLAIIFSNSVNVTTSKNTWFKLRAALLIDLPDLDRFVVGNYNKSGFPWNPGFNGPYSAI